MTSGVNIINTPQAKGPYEKSSTPAKLIVVENAQSKPALSKRVKFLSLLFFGIISISVIAIIATTGSSNVSNEGNRGRPPRIESGPTNGDPSFQSNEGNRGRPSRIESGPTKGNPSFQSNEGKEDYVDRGKNLSTSTHNDFSKCDNASHLCTMEHYRYKDIHFEWKNPKNYEWADTSSVNDAVQAGKFQTDHILLDRKVRSTPMRTKASWHGEKIVYVEWIASESSDTNIWMLNKKIHPQFGVNNGWPYYGELDIFEMFPEEKRKHPHYDFHGFKEFHDVSSYGQLTLHYGASPEKPCFCPSSHTKAAWYKHLAPLTSGCSGQFKNTPNKKNSMATIFGSDNHGQYLQLIQNPVITKGKDNTFKFEEIHDNPDSIATPKIYNNKDLFWGTPVTECSAGHNPKNGFPFFEDFRLIFEEQAMDGHFMVTDVRIFVP